MLQKKIWLTLLGEAAAVLLNNNKLGKTGKFMKILGTRTLEGIVCYAVD